MSNIEYQKLYTVKILARLIPGLIYKKKYLIILNLPKNIIFNVFSGYRLIKTTSFRMKI